MLELKALKICFLLATLFVWDISADCSLTVDGDAPVFSKTLGSKTLILRNGQSSLMLKRGETIRADCPRQISLRSIYNYNDLVNDNAVMTTLSLKCDYSSSYRDERFFYTTSTSSFSYLPLSMNSVFIKCVQGKRQLYESNATLPNCEPHTSYVIGTQSNWRDPIISASICFDLSNVGVKYIKYQPNRADFEFSNIEDRTPPRNLGSPIEGFDILFKNSNGFDNTINTFKKSNQLLELHQFNYLSLLQDSTISTELADFEFMFKIIWWNNLRLGSWKFFFDTLKSRTENGEYEVYTGTSGVMVIPSASECKQLEEFTIKEVGGNREVHAPAIIWAYLRSTNENKTEDFVIVGHNTPFSFVHNSTQFCKDICHEIDWLNGSLFDKVRKMPTLGVVECCRPNEVQFKLEGFPRDLLKEKENVTENQLESGEI